MRSPLIPQMTMVLSRLRSTQRSQISHYLAARPRLTVVFFMRKKPEYGLAFGTQAACGGDEARTFGSRANTGFGGGAPISLFLVMPHCVAAIPRCLRRGSSFAPHKSLNVRRFSLNKRECNNQNDQRLSTFSQ
jgi:hypothetical protein